MELTAVHDVDIVVVGLPQGAQRPEVVGHDAHRPADGRAPGLGWHLPPLLGLHRHTKVTEPKLASLKS